MANTKVIESLLREQKKTSEQIIDTIASNAGIPTIRIPSTTSAQELIPNVIYIFTERSGDLTLTLGTPVIGKANQYHLFLTTENSETIPTITWPNYLQWAGGNEPTIDAGKTYEVDILNNVAVFMEI